MKGTDALGFTLADFETAAAELNGIFSPTPQISWPLLNQRCGCEVWIKHENHLPTGSFKIRGGIWYTKNRLKSRNESNGVIAATRGNHGQSVALSAFSYRIPASVVVPFGNSIEKNRAMVAYGAELIQFGTDFNDSLEHAHQLATERDLNFFPSFHPLLVQGVGTYAIEFFRRVLDLHTIYVPIGMGSGICGMIAARNALNLKTEIVGVVAEKAPAYALSFAHRKTIDTSSSDTIADGLAVRKPHPEALEFILNGASRIVAVTEKQILNAIGFFFRDTHNIAEGAGASPLAALLTERKNMQGRKVGLVLSGGNIDWELFLRANEQPSTSCKGY